MVRFGSIFSNLSTKKKNLDLTSNNETPIKVSNEASISVDVITYKSEDQFEDYLQISITEEKSIDQNSFSVETERSKEPSDLKSVERFLSTEDSAPVLDSKDVHISTWLRLKNKSVVDYCVELVNTRERISRKLNKVENQPNVVDQTAEPKYKSLGELLESIDAFLKLEGNWCWMAGALPTDVKNPFSYFVEKLIEFRKIKDKERFIKDADKFLQIYKSRSGEIDVLKHKDYWGTLQQLISGKVIADFVAEDYGPLDPVFGVLLNPTTGRVGPGDTGLIHNILFDHDGPWAHHAAVHDAFGYLKTFHNIGPGYNYLGGVSAVETDNCLSGQASGLLFWKETLSKVKEINSENSKNKVEN